MKYVAYSLRTRRRCDSLALRTFAAVTTNAAEESLAEGVRPRCPDQRRGYLNPAPGRDSLEGRARATFVGVREDEEMVADSKSGHSTFGDRARLDDEPISTESGQFEPDDVRRANC